MEPQDLVLGQRYRDRNTGYTGVAICRTEWQNGCWRITLERLGKDEKVEDHTFDIELLEPAAEETRDGPKIKPPGRSGGGGRSDPARAGHPGARR